MDAERLERAARAAFEEWMRREEPSYDCSEDALFATFFDGYRAALAAPEPASAEAVAREAAETALRDFCRMEYIPLDRIQPSDIDLAVAHALRAGKGA